jgi:hypothetical protein
MREDAELLLAYASEMGIKVEDNIRDSILKSRFGTNGGGMTEEVAANLLSALASLAASVRPVTVESLKTWRESQERNGNEKHKPSKRKDPTLRLYWISALSVGLLVMFSSLITFVSSRVSETIKTDVDTANGLAAKLALELGPPPSTNMLASATTQVMAGVTPAEQVWFGPNGPPPGVSSKDVITDLQKFAATMRAIYANSRQLNHFVLDSVYVPFSNPRTDWADLKGKLELTPGLGLLLTSEFTSKIGIYQEIRNFANTVQNVTSIYYGAMATSVLPVLYALLGAAAYLLRLYDDQVRNRTFIAADKHVARFLIAGIGGLVVGQFNVNPGVAISPFAVAFLVGYAAELFFTFLDGLLQMFKRDPGSKSSSDLPAVARR